MDAGDSLSDSGCRRLYQTVDAGENQTADAGDSPTDSESGVSPSDSGCMRLSIRQRMQESLLQTADAGDSQSDCGSMRLYWTADA